MSVVQLVRALEEEKTKGVFAAAGEDAIYDRYLKPFLTLPQLNWETAVGNYNPVTRCLNLTEAVRLYLFNGGLATDERQQRAARDDSRVILDLAVLTNFDYWEVFYRGEAVVQYTAAQFVTGDFTAPTSKWKELTSILSREAVSSGQHLARVDELSKSKEDLIEPLLREFERLREEIGNALIKDPRGLKLLKIKDKEDDALLNAAVQRLIDRFIIFRFAEDNRILPAGNPQPLRHLYYSRLRSADDRQLAGQHVVWDRIRGTDRRDRGLFGEFAEKYNGGVFLPLDGARRDIVHDLPLTDDHVKRIIEKIANIPFQQELAKVIGFIYEKYIGKKLYIKTLSASDPRRNRVALENTPEKKNQGIYYTPEDVCNYITDNTVGVLMRGLLAQLDAALEKDGPEKAAALLALLEEARQTTVCDPACGGGSFLVPALRHFREFYRRLRREMD